MISTSEYNAMLARLNRQLERGEIPSIDGAQRESDLHAQIYAECQRRGWIALHGSMSAETHRTLGEADFTILAGNGQVLFVECKSKTGKLSPAQLAMKAHMAKLGHTMHVVRSLADFLTVIDAPASIRKRVEEWDECYPKGSLGYDKPGEQ